MINDISIENFKSIDSLNLELSKINIFIGQNRSGKSSVAQAFGLLKQSNQDKIEWNGVVVPLKDFENVVNKISKQKEIRIGFSGKEYASARLEEISGTHQYKFSYSITINERGIREIAFDIDPNHIAINGSVGRQGNDIGKKEIVIGKTRVNFRSNNRPHKPIEISGGSYSEEDRWSMEIIDECINELLNVFKRFFERSTFIPALRGYDVSTYSLSETNSTTIPTGHGLSKQAEESASAIAYNNEDARKVSEILSKIIPDIRIGHRLSPKQVEVISEDKYGIFNITNEGFGLNQLCFLFQQFVKSKKDSVIFIEEPEIALHPQAHVDVCNAIMEEIEDKSRQVIITTHSEHVLLSFLDAVMDKRIRPDQLRVYYFERENGLTNATLLPVTERGEIKGGLRGFLEADLHHLEKFLDSLKKK